MKVSQMSILKDSNVNTGLARYDAEIIKNCSKHIDVKQFHSQGNKIKTLVHFNENKGDINHITTHQYALLLHLLQLKNSVITVHDLIQDDWYSVKRKIQEFWYPDKWSLPYFSRYIVDASYTKELLINRYGINEEKIKVIPLGVDHELYKPMNKEIARKYFSLDPDKKYCLAISSGEIWKNTELLNQLNGDYEILDIGYGRGRYGFIPENMMPALYSAVDVFLSPSLDEGFCLPVIEAQACGTPCIVSSCSALPETCGNGGIAVNPYRPELWKEAIGLILESHSYWKSKAIKHASKYSWEKCGLETVKVYQELM